MELDAVRAMNVREVGAELGAQDSQQGLFQRLVKRHLASVLPGRRRDLASDETGAQDAQALAAFDSLAKLHRRGQLAEVRRAIHAGQAARVGTGGDAHHVPRHGPAAFEPHQPMLDVDLGHALAEDEIDRQLAILRAGPQGEAFASHGAKEVALGQMRPLVWRLGLGADQLDVAREARVAHAGRHPVAGRAGADDYCLAATARHGWDLLNSFQLTDGAKRPEQESAQQRDRKRVRDDQVGHGAASGWGAATTWAGSTALSFSSISVSIR